MHLEYRWTAGDLELTRRFAQEIVDLKPDLIVVHSTPAVNAVRKLTTTTPMVFALIADPLGSGFAASLARPGGNMTEFHERRCSHGQQMAGSSSSKSYLRSNALR